MSYYAPCPTPHKMAFRTKKDAKLALRRYRAVSSRDDVQAYRCACGGFHVGHKPGTVNGRRLWVKVFVCQHGGRHEGLNAPVGLGCGFLHTDCEWKEAEE